jgi:hypothetical protein
METTLVLIWLLPGPTVSVPMPNQFTCERAIAEAKRELSPDGVYCAPKRAPSGHAASQARTRPAEPEEQKKYRAAEEIVLNIQMTTLSSSPIIQVRMPDRTTCEQAIVGAKSDLDPARVYCTPKVARRSESATVSIIRNMKREEQNDLCTVCIKRFPELYLDR